MPTLLAGCSYSFNTASLPPGIETISVQQFQNNASIVVPDLAQSFSRELRDQFTGQSRLVLVQRGGDLNLSGAITGYDISPVNVGSDDQAAQNRLTMRVFVSYENAQQPSDSWEQEFTSYVDFDRDADFSSQQAGLNQELNQQLAQDIFNRAFGKW